MQIFTEKQLIWCEKNHIKNDIICDFVGAFHVEIIERRLLESTFSTHEKCKILDIIKRNMQEEEDKNTISDL